MVCLEGDKLHTNPIHLIQALTLTISRDNYTKFEWPRNALECTQNTLALSNFPEASTIFLNKN